MKCKACGHTYDNHSDFCPDCGYSEPVQAAKEEVGQEQAQQKTETPAEQTVVETDAQPQQDAPKEADARTEYTDEQREQMHLKSARGNAVGSLVCGILAFFIPFVGIVLAIVAIVLGSSAKKKLPTDEGGLATAGFVLGIVSLVFSVLAVIVFINILGVAAFAVSEAGSMYSSPSWWN